MVLLLGAMDWVQVALGLVAGVVYSVFGWLRNRMNYRADLPSEEEVAERIAWIKQKGVDSSVFMSLIEDLSLLLEEVKASKIEFNKREFLVTVAQGLVIGLLMGGLGLPLDISVSLATQLGLLAVIRKIIGMVKL